MDNQEGSLLKQFVDEISNLPSYYKVAQIGNDKEALGVPKDCNFKNLVGITRDFPFDSNESMKKWPELPVLRSDHNIISSFPDSTLFFMFYNQPSSIVQIAAGEELKNRGWELDEYTWCKQIDGVKYKFDIHSWLSKESRAVLSK